MAAGVTEVKADIPALSINTTNGETGTAFLLRHLNSCSLPLDILDKHVSDANISLFPNPTSYQFSINGMAPTYQVSIFDATGRLIQNIDQAEKNHAMDVSKIVRGMYIVSVSDLSNNVLLVQKFHLFLKL